MTTGRDKVTRDDIESRLRGLVGEVEAAGESAKSSVSALVPVAAVAVVVVAYLLGRRKGRKRSTVVEIRRI